MKWGDKWDDDDDDDGMIVWYDDSIDGMMMGCLNDWIDWMIEDWMIVKIWSRMELKVVLMKVNVNYVMYDVL